MLCIVVHSMDFAKIVEKLFAVAIRDPDYLISQRVKCINKVGNPIV